MPRVLYANKIRDISTMPQAQIETAMQAHNKPPLEQPATESPDAPTARIQPWRKFVTVDESQPHAFSGEEKSIRMIAERVNGKNTGG